MPGPWAPSCPSSLPGGSEDQGDIECASPWLAQCCVDLHCPASPEPSTRLLDLSSNEALTGSQGGPWSSRMPSLCAPPSAQSQWWVCALPGPCHTAVATPAPCAHHHAGCRQSVASAQATCTPNGAAGGVLVSPSTSELGSPRGKNVTQEGPEQSQGTRSGHQVEPEMPTRLLRGLSPDLRRPAPPQPEPEPRGGHLPREAGHLPCVRGCGRLQRACHH